MITGIGVDATSVARITQSHQRFGERFVHRLLHPDERAGFTLSASPDRFLAKRFAIKEAASKALGTGIREGVSLHDFITTHDALGKPHLELAGEASRRAAQAGIVRVHLSLTDEGDIVTAFVICEAN